MLIIVGALIKILLVILVCTVFLILLIHIIEIKWQVFSNMMPNREGINWLENISEHGALAKDGYGEIHYIKPLCDKSYWLVNRMLPLTPQEIWRLMPWNSMDSAPIDKTILLKNKLGVVHSCLWSGSRWHSWENGSTFCNPIAWLPLPDANLHQETDNS